MEVQITKEYKDRLFRLVFGEKEDLLALYNAVNESAYSNPEQLAIVTLENMLYLKMKNDISFLIGDILNLYEHQSTLNPNMPVRGFLYFAETYQKYLMKHKYRLYGKKLIPLPRPKYIVFYNGLEDQPDRVELKMSDAFPPASDAGEPCLECRAIMLNINAGHNSGLMDKCRKLKEYSIFVEKVRTKLQMNLPFDEAADAAIQECIQENILKDILTAHRAEVIDMLFTEYDEQEHMAFLKEEGLEEGIKEGENRVNQLIRLLIENGRSSEIEKAVTSHDFQESLFQEFGL